MITSTSNPIVKQLVRLQKKSAARKKEEIFLAEGLRLFRETPRESIRELYVSEMFWAKEEHRQLLRGLPVEVMSDHVFSRIADTTTPQGILCVVKRPCYTLDEMLKKRNPHLLILENLQDPGNLGTILRTAEGAGVTGMILNDLCVDVYNPKTIRSTMGSIYRLPFVYVPDLAEAIAEIKRNEVRVFAAHLEAIHNYDEENYGQGTAFILGNEGNGLTDATAALADAWVRIPMCGQVESLNVAIAAAVFMFEVSRQRR